MLPEEKGAAVQLIEIILDAQNDPLFKTCPPVVNFAVLDEVLQRHKCLFCQPAVPLLKIFAEIDQHKYLILPNISHLKVTNLPLAYQGKAALVPLWCRLNPISRWKLR